jgi:predicted nucleic acid-binding protein
MAISVITIQELETGNLLVARSDRAQSQLLSLWLHEFLVPNFSGRILDVDLRVALRCAQLHVPNKRQMADSLIAATALVHDLIVVTRNVGDFASTGVRLLNPWDD